jgi:hypothetical protein
MHTTVLVHLVGDMIKVIRTPEVLGIQGKKKIIDKRIGDGAGLGGALRLSFQAFKYHGVEEGFAESDLDEYDGAAAGLAWSRSLGVVRKALRISSDIERIRDDQLDREFQLLLPHLFSPSVNNTNKTHEKAAYKKPSP